MTHAWRFSLLLFPVAAAALAFGGCSGDDSTNFTGTDGDGGATDGAPDATTIPDGGSETDTGTGLDSGPGVDSALPCPTYTGTDPYCKALVDYCGRCSAPLEACDLDNFAKCDKISAAYSKAGRAAAVECLGKVQCSRDVGPAVDKCLKDKLVNANPSPADDKVRQDVCDQCIADDAGSAACVAEFFVHADGGAAGGIFVLEFNDGVANAIDTTCAAGGRPDAGDGGAGACAAKFALCAGAVVATALPKDACKDGG